MICEGFDVGLTNETHGLVGKDVAGEDVEYGYAEFASVQESYEWKLEEMCPGWISAVASKWPPGVEECEVVLEENCTCCYAAYTVEVICRCNLRRRFRLC